MLGQGSAPSARLCAKVSLCFAPVLWALNCVLYLEPHLQPLFIGIFTNGSDPELAHNLRLLMFTMVVLNAPDAIQIIMGGVFQVGTTACIQPSKCIT